MRRALFVFSLCSVGCTLPKDDPNAIGRFEVLASRFESCGDQVALASPAQATFQVYLRKTSEEMLLWDDGRERWPLAKQGDGTFAGGTRVAIAMDLGEPEVVEVLDLFDPDPEPEPAGAVCVMQRIDTLEVELLDDAFTGTLAHTFGVQDGSDCSAVMAGPPPLADSLPCAVAYDLDATRLP